MVGLEVEAHSACSAAARQCGGRRSEVRSRGIPTRKNSTSAASWNGREELQIVCGAPNVRVGMKAPLALIGAKLPNGMEIKQAKLRGVESSGMLCSARELGLSEDASGLFDLPAVLQAGQELVAALGLNDTIFEVNLTPNRGDCMSVAGVAREVAALRKQPLRPPAMNPVEAQSQGTLSGAAGRRRSLSEVRQPRRSRHSHRTRKSPFWMQERLRRAGLRPISAVVDVTNYVMLELGQPLHAYDLNKLHGSIIVRHARAGETLKMLDGRVVELTPETLMIADERTLLGMGGVIGRRSGGPAAAASTGPMDARSAATPGMVRASSVPRSPRSRPRAATSSSGRGEPSPGPRPHSTGRPSPPMSTHPRSSRPCTTPRSCRSASVAAVAAPTPASRATPPIRAASTGTPACAVVSSQPVPAAREPTTRTTPGCAAADSRAAVRCSRAASAASPTRRTTGTPSTTPIDVTTGTPPAYGNAPKCIESRELRDAQAEGDLVGEEAAVDGEHDAAGSSGVRLDEARAASSASSAAAGHAAAGAQRELQRLEGAGVGVEALVGRLDATRRRRRRRCSARACARSRTGGRRGASARRSRCPGTRPSSSRGGCGGTRGRAGPSSRSRTSPGPAAPSRSAAARYLSAWSSSSGWRAGSAASGVPGLDGERVGGHVRRVEGERVVERAAPVVERLAGAAVDEVEVERREAAAARAARRPARTLAAVVGAAERGEHVGASRLHAERQPVHAAGARRCRRSSGGDGVGVALDRDLAPGARGMRSSTATRSAAGTSDGVPPPTNTDVAARQPGGRRAGRRRRGTRRGRRR